jgi:hypothetical protein
MDSRASRLPGVGGRGVAWLLCRVCSFLLGAVLPASVFFLCLLLPVAGTASLTAGRFALMVAVKTPLSIAPSNSLRVKAVHLYQPFHGMCNCRRRCPVLV